MATLTVNTGQVSFTTLPIPTLTGAENIMQWGKVLMLTFRLLKYDHLISISDGGPFEHTRRYQNRKTGRWYRIDTATKRLIEFDPAQERRDRHAAMLIVEGSISPEVKRMLVADGYDDTSCEPDVLYRYAFNYFHWVGEKQREVEKFVQQTTYYDSDGNEVQIKETFLGDDSGEEEEFITVTGNASGEKGEASGDKGQAVAKK